MNNFRVIGKFIVSNISKRCEGCKHKFACFTNNKNEISILAESYEIENNAKWSVRALFDVTDFSECLEIDALSRGIFEIEFNGHIGSTGLNSLIRRDGKYYIDASSHIEKKF